MMNTYFALIRQTVKIVSLIGLISFGLVVIPGYSQSSEYAIESFQGSYNELAEFSSIAILTKGDLLWDYEFELEFLFPFYDQEFASIIYDNDASGIFPGALNYSLLLMRYSTYTIENVTDTVNIMSDVRFAHVVENGLQAFVVEFAKARIFADPFEDSLDTYLNFQHWYFENGVIEVRFGEMHMDGTPLYAPGKGFYQYTSTGGVDTTYIAGPLMSIVHPDDFDNSIGLHGSYDDYDVVAGPYAVLSVLPPIGWVIRFVPEWVSAVGGPSRYEEVAICPNPASAFIRLPEGAEKVSVVDAHGRTVYRGQPGMDRLDVSGFGPGLYVVQYVQGGRVSVGRFVRM